MALNFGLLTGYAFASPFAYVLLYVGPNEFFSDGLPSSLYPWVTEAMNDVENTTPVGEGHEWTSWPVRDINKQVSGSHFYLSKTEASPSISFEGP